MAIDNNNNVEFQHPKYVQHQHQVQLCMDCYNGIDSVKSYLVPRANENDTDFENRKEKAIFSNFVERIVTTQAGMIFSKPVTYDEIPDKVVPILDDMDIAEFLKDACKMGIRDGKSYIMVDMPTNGGDPYFTHISREQLINWRKDEEGNFTMVVIAESYEEIDGFNIEYKTQYRVIDEMGNIDIWRGNNMGMSIVESITTTYNFLPLYELNTGDVPPLYDIATININHFNAFSEKDSIISTSTQPSFFTKGLGIDEGEQLKIGVNYTINTDNDTADVRWVELDGQSIPYAQDDLDRKENMMAERALQVQGESQSTKTATQVSVENSESSSRLEDIKEDLQNTANKAYDAWYSMKYSTDAVGSIMIQSDFKTVKTPLSDLNISVAAGTLSKYSAIKTMMRDGAVDVESVDEELERIDEEFMPIEEVSTDDTAGQDA